MEGKTVLSGFLVTGSCHLDFQRPPPSQHRLAEEKETGFKPWDSFPIRSQSQPPVHNLNSLPLKVRLCFMPSHIIFPKLQKNCFQSPQMKLRIWCFERHLNQIWKDLKTGILNRYNGNMISLITGPLVLVTGAGRNLQEPEKPAFISSRCSPHLPVTVPSGNRGDDLLPLG